MKHARKLICFVLALAMLIPAFSLQAKADTGRVTVGVAKAEGSMDLTEMGNADWMHFTGTGSSRKAAPGSNGDSIDFLNPSAGDGRTFGQQNDQVWRWQSFKSDIGGELKKLEVALYRNGSPSDVIAKLYKAEGNTWTAIGETVVPESSIVDRTPLALDFGTITIEPGVYYAVAMTQKVLNNTTNQWMWCNSETGFPNGKIVESGEWKTESTAASLRVTIGEPKTVGLINFEMFGGMTMDYTMTDSAVEYSWSDGIPNQSASNVRTGGVFHYRDGQWSGEVDASTPVGWKLTVPAADTLQTLTFVSGVMNASFEIDIYANGDTENPVYQNKELSATEPSKLLTYTVTIAPNTSVEVYAKLTNKHTVWGNASLCAVALNREQKASAVTVEVAGAGGGMDLTALGTTDWVHFTSERIDRKAAQSGEAGGELIDFLNPNASSGRTFGQVTDQFGRWQSFMSTTGGKLTKLEVALYRQGNPSDVSAGLFKAQTDGTWAPVNGLITVPASTIEDRKPLALDFGDVTIEPNVYYAVVLCQATPSQSDNWMWCNAETSFPNGKILESGAWVIENTAASLRVTIGTPATETVDRIGFETVGGMKMDSTMNDSAALYSWSDGIPTKSASGVKTGGVLNYQNGQFQGKLDETAAWKLSIPASSAIQTLTFVSGVWESSCEIYIYVNGDTENPVYSNQELTAHGTSKLLTYTVTVAPDTSVEVYGKMTEKFHLYGNMSLCAATLSESALDPSDDYIVKLRAAVQDGEDLLEDDLDDYFKNQIEAALKSAKAALAKDDLTQSEAYSEYIFLMTAINAAKNAPIDGTFANVYASGATCSFGWEGDKDAPILWVDGTYLLRDNGNKVITFGVSELGAKSVKWYNKEGYLPCFVSEYEKDGLKHTVENFADLVVIDGKSYEVAYSRMTTTNTSDTEKRLPRVSKELVALNEAASQRRIAAGETVVRDYCIGADRFGNSYAYPEDTVLAQQGSWDEHYAHMRTYWNDRLDGIVKITSVPEEYSDLINAYKAGYIYTLIIADGYELHVGENGYDRVFDHDVIGMLATLIEAGHTEHFADYAQYILQNIQYPDAAWKFSWPFALYLEKTGDYDTVLSFFEDQNGTAGIKTNTRKIAAEREVQDASILDGDGKVARIMKMTNAIDSNGKWTIDNWAALFGLTTYKYLCDKLSAHAASDADKAYYQAESDWAAAEYDDLLKSVEAVLKNTMEKYNFNYIPISMILPNELTERSNLGDGNWAAHYLFGRWN